MAKPTCDYGSYLEHVACEVRQPAWMSDVGIPMAATLIGLGVAVILVRSQIRHDRKLRQADRLVPAVVEFGRIVLAAVDKGWNTAGTDPYWDRIAWGEDSKIYYARERLSVALAQPDACEEVLRGALDIARVWTACVERRNELEKRGIALSTVAMGLGIDAACTPLWNDLREAGETLSRWDGLEDLPNFAPWPHPHLPRAGPKSSERKKAAQRRWLKYYADEFERVALKHKSK